jgi:alginate O-acetyltransferase complex protein AlgI
MPSGKPALPCHAVFSPRASSCGFLPLVLAAYYATARRGLVREWVLLAASLVFYWWDVRFLPVLLGQATATWGADALPRWATQAGCGLAWPSTLPRSWPSNTRSSPPARSPGSSASPHHRSRSCCPSSSASSRSSSPDLVDVARGDAFVYPWRRVTLFVALFPHLIAGPIVRRHQIMPQLDADPLRPGLAERFAKGAAFFVIGCVKKVLLADPMARFADPIFSAAATSTPSLVDAWHATLACLSAVPRLLRL